MSDSSGDSSNEEMGDEIPMYDQLAILDKPAQTPSLVKVLLSPRRSPRHAPMRIVQKASDSAPPTSSKSASKRKLRAEGDASAMKAKHSIPASKEEQKYDFRMMIDIIDSVAYDAKTDDVRNLGLPEDVTKMVTMNFVN